jgi:acyl dehydratase
MDLPVNARSLAIGQRVSEYVIDYSADHIQGYEAAVPTRDNFHNSPQKARDAGFAQPFASGTMIVAHTIENLLPGVFGEGWTRAGTVNAAFIHPILAGSQVLLAADVVAKLPRGDDTLVVMQLSATLPTGEQLIAGHASAIAKG